MSLQEGDKAAAAVAVAPRVSLSDIEKAIVGKFETTADVAMSGSHKTIDADTEFPKVMDQLRLLSLCVLVMRNGFTVVGKSAPASAANFNAELGKRFAYEDAIRQLWPLMGFALREKLNG